MAASGVGFANLGASCFINAGLQVIFSVPRLCQAIETGTSETEQALQTVLGLVRHAQGRVMPKPITDMFYEGRQQDAGEFILRVLAECSAAHHLLGGEEAPRFRCQHCNYTRPLSMERFLSLQIPLMAATPARSVQQALDAYLAAEHVQADVQNWCCLNFDCLDASRACDDPLHTTDISVWPEVLLLFLKRWDAAHGLLNHQVHCNDILTAGAHRYKLQSLATHIGPTPTSGHYVAYCRCNSGFLRMDDDKVGIVAADATQSFAIVPDEKVYVALYVKYIPSSEEEDPEHPGDSPRPPAVKRPAIDLDSDSDLPSGKHQNTDIDSNILPVPDEPSKKAFRFGRTPVATTIDLDNELADSEKDNADSNVVQKADSDSDMIVALEPPAHLPRRASKRQGAPGDANLPEARPAKQALSSFSEAEKVQIAEIIRSSTTAKQAIAALSSAFPSFNTQKPNSQHYISRYTIRNWIKNSASIDKVMSAPNAQPGKVRSSIAGSARDSLNTEARAAVGSALQAASTTSELIQILHQNLPGFSSTDREAEHYIARGTLHNWRTRPSIPKWFAAPESSHTNWDEEFQHSFAITFRRPAKRTLPDLPVDDHNGRWLLHGAWTFCPSCGRRRPRTQTATLALSRSAVLCSPACDTTATALLAPPQCGLTRVKLEGYVTPLPSYWQPWLSCIGKEGLPMTQLVSSDELRDLAVLDIKVEFRSRRGGHADICSKQKRTVVRGRWRPISLYEITRSDAAARAFSWLLENNSTYSRWVQHHSELVRGHGAADNWREIPTAELLLASPGIEVAARPWLYPLPSFGDTDLTSRLTSLGWVDAGQKPSTRCSFLRKLCSRCVEYTRDFPLHCLLYDTCMARTITSVMSVANQKQIAPEQTASDMDMFEGYWLQQLRKMEDICRQEYEHTSSMCEALPNIFFTVAPAEWRYILAHGLFYEEALTEQQDMITLHLYHSMQALLEVHLLKHGASLQRVGIAKIRQWSFRFEFQSRGTLHVHAVLWADLLPGITAADITARTNSGKTSAFLDLLHDLFRSRADVQCGDGTHCLLRYVAGYLTKASDALQFQAAQAESNHTQWRQAYRLLSKRSPTEQEILMEFAGLAMVKHSFSGLSIFAPIPGSNAKNSSRHQYAAYQHHLTQEAGAFGDARNLTFVQWLRKYRVHAKDFTLANRNEAGPARGKSCGVAMSFPFELLDVYVGSWAAASLEGMLEERLLPDVPDNLRLVGFEDELLRRRSFQAPEGCRHLKAVLCLNDFQSSASSTPSIFNPDVSKLLAAMERELIFRGLTQDRIATFKAKIRACSLLLLKIRDGQEDAAMWTARKLPGTPVRDWSPEQLEVLEKIRTGTSVGDASEVAKSVRLLQICGGPGTGKTEVVIAAAKQALDDGCKVLIAGPIGLLVSMYRPYVQFP